jgi:hypothetical protein
MHAALALAGLSSVTPYRPGPSPAPFVTLMVLGFVVGIAGHLFRSRLIVGLGIVMIFAATVLLPLQYAGDFQ